MRFIKVILKNFVCKETQDFNFEQVINPSELIIGFTEDLGKITLSDAIIIALYGKHNRCRIRRGLSYEKFLRMLIPKTITYDDITRIELTLKVDSFGESFIITIVRYWSAIRKEGFGIIVNEEWPDRSLANKWEEIVPYLLIDEIALFNNSDAHNKEISQDFLESRNNQGIRASQQWKGLYFRSKPEIQIAEALDQAGVLFYPNCKARLNSSGNREVKETDFLVCLEGKWGILEVDGEPWHPPSRTVHDHERDRLFKSYGIRVVEHYDANRCLKEPEKVVQEFLEILNRS